jgi:hypothetical protein
MKLPSGLAARIRIPQQSPADQRRFESAAGLPFQAAYGDEGQNVAARAPDSAWSDRYESVGHAPMSALTVNFGNPALTGSHREPRAVSKVAVTS